MRVGKNPSNAVDSGLCPPLGNTAKSSPPTKLQENRAKRFELLSVARSIFIAEGVKQGLKHASDFHRTACCKYHPVGSHVAVHRSKAVSKAFFTGLQTCGSVWACPVCAAKIQEKRRIEVAKAVSYAYANDLQPVLVTLTFPHKFADSLKDLLKAQADALARLRKGKQWDKFKAEINFSGLIRSLELTFGANGWHPHTHELWFVGKDVDPELIKEEVVDRWWSACTRAGLVTDDDLHSFYRHAVDVKGNCSASDYLAKQDSSKHWGVDREVAKASSKQGKASGLHPFAFLTEENRNPSRWLEYTQAIKGKSQLFWSHGLKATMCIADKSDQELAEESTEGADMLGMLSPDDWRAIRKAEKRSEVLDIAENFPTNEAWSKIRAMIRTLSPPLP